MQAEQVFLALFLGYIWLLVRWPRRTLEGTLALAMYSCLAIAAASPAGALRLALGTGWAGVAFGALALGAVFHAMGLAAYAIDRVLGRLGIEDSG